MERKGKEIDSWFTAKTRDFGGNSQAIFAPDGIALWVSDVLPGATHDITAARRLVLGILQPCLRNLPVLADPGYAGAGPWVLTPVKNRQDGFELDLDTRTWPRSQRGAPS